MTGNVDTWLHIVGIGEDGMAGLLPATRAIVEAAEVIVGGERHHHLSGVLCRPPRLSIIRSFRRFSLLRQGWAGAWRILRR